MNRVVLASASPRREELLRACGFEVLVCPSNAPEHYEENTPPKIVVSQLSMRKAEEVSKKYPDEFVVAADTIVVHEGKILEKPSDREDAYNMISALNGKTHRVFTGVCVIYKGKRRSFCDFSAVTFYKLSKPTIERYLDCANYLDKAGAYAIDEEASLFVKKIEGSFATVKGLPVSRLIKELLTLSRKDGNNELFTKIL